MSGSVSHSIRQRLADNKEIIANAVGFQLVWFICVQGNNFYAIVAVLVLLLLYRFTFSPNLKAWKALIIFSVLGYLGDGLISYVFQLNYAEATGIFSSSIPNDTVALSTENSSYALPNPLTIFAPLWLLSLWIAFATTLNHSMKWILKTPALIIVIALFLVPISYLAGIKLSSSQFMASLNDLNTFSFFLIEGVWWALLLSLYKKTVSFNTNSVISHE